MPKGLKACGASRTMTTTQISLGLNPIDHKSTQLWTRQYSIQNKPVQRLKKSFQDAKEVSSGHKRSQFRMQKKSVLNENKGGFHF